MSGVKLTGVVTDGVVDGAGALVLGLPIVAILASTLFAGAALYVSLVEHPARLSCGTELAATEFGPSYKRATVMQVALAVLARSPA